MERLAHGRSREQTDRTAVRGGDHNGPAELVVADQAIERRLRCGAGRRDEQRNARAGQGAILAMMGVQVCRAGASEVRGVRLI
jgi:hypothetical protein